MGEGGSARTVVCEASEPTVDAETASDLSTPDAGRDIIARLQRLGAAGRGIERDSQEDPDGKDMQSAVAGLGPFVQRTIAGCCA
jgi:hypothetical protein